LIYQIIKGVVKSWNLATGVTVKGKGCHIKKGIRKKMETYDSKTCLLFAYHLATTIIMQ
jgi:hypothetical protein